MINRAHSHPRVEDELLYICMQLNDVALFRFTEKGDIIQLQSWEY